MLNIEQFVEILPKWKGHCNRYFTERTVGHYSMVLRMFKDYLQKDGGLFTAEAVRGFIDDLLLRGRRRTANAYLTALKSFCKWYSREYEQENPTEKVKMLKEDEPNQRILSPEEYQKVLLAAKGIDNDIIVFLANTGLRKTEFRKLDWRNIAPDLSYIKLQGKGRKVRLIPLNSRCKDILNQYPKEDRVGPVELTERYPGIEGIYWLCKKIAKKSGIKGFGPHALRHYFATELMRKSVPLVKISKILGHSSIKTTERIYIHFMPEDFIGLTECLES